MKKLLIILSGIILFNNLCANENLKSTLDTAFNHYLNENYTEAINIYDSIYLQGNSSAELFYNMGNCYYKIGDIANAIYFYEKAKILNPNDKDIKHNLNIANQSIKDNIETIPEIFYMLWYHSIESLMSSDAWLITSIIIFIISLILLSYYLFSRKIIIRKIGFIVGITCLILSVVCFLLSKNGAKKITDSPYAIVFESSLIKSSPNEGGINLFEVNEGLKVEIINTVNSWNNIRLSDGKEGWIQGYKVKK